MRCWECGAELDELNESQPVCPACGAPPGIGRDDADVCALLDDAALIAAAPDDAEDTDPGLGPGLDQQEEPVRMPLDLREALDDAESLLLATGHATFDRSEEHTSELQSLRHLGCRLLLEKKVWESGLSGWRGGVYGLCCRWCLAAGS